VEEVFDDQASALERHQAYLKSIGYEEPLYGGASGEDETLEAMEALKPSVPDTGESIWPVTHSWDWSWELRFSKWIETSVDRFFFVKYKIPTDCADVIISLRWIFARMNGLPIANTLSGSHRMVGSMTLRPEWKSLPTAQNWYEDQRFLAALDYIRSSTYTKSLGSDSYPVAITRPSLIPGIHHLEYHELGGHAMIVKEVKVSGKTAEITVMDSTLPVQIRRLGQKAYIFGDLPTPGMGFLRVMWPVYENGIWTFMDPEAYPDYSPEQYDPSFMIGSGTFSAAVKSHLTGHVNFDAEEWQKTLKSLQDAFVTRANVVYDGYYACLQTNCEKGTPGWEEYSTPNRDSRLLGLLEGVLRGVKIYQGNFSAMRDWKHFLQGKLQYDKGIMMTYAEAVDNFVDGRYNSDPRQSIRARWGL
jgi:hypothetical protein